MQGHVDDWQLHATGLLLMTSIAGAPVHVQNHSALELQALHQKRCLRALCMSRYAHPRRLQALYQVRCLRPCACVDRHAAHGPCRLTLLQGLRVCLNQGLNAQGSAREGCPREPECTACQPLRCTP